MKRRKRTRGQSSSPRTIQRGQGKDSSWKLEIRNELEGQGRADPISTTEDSGVDVSRGQEWQQEGIEVLKSAGIDEATQLESEEALAKLQAAAGGSSQGTLALFKTRGKTQGGDPYLIEQQTTTKVWAAADQLGITYVPQGRLSGFHAEMRFVAHAEKEGIDLERAEVWVSKPVCSLCRERLQVKGCSLKSCSTDTAPERWLDPDTLEPTDLEAARVRNPQLTFTSHQSESQRLKRGRDYREMEASGEDYGSIEEEGKRRSSRLKRLRTDDGTEFATTAETAGTETVGTEIAGAELADVAEVAELAVLL